MLRFFRRDQHSLQPDAPSSVTEGVESPEPPAPGSILVGDLRRVHRPGPVDRRTIRLREWLATSAAMLLLLPVLVVFLLPGTGFAHPTLGVSGDAVRGLSVTVRGGGYDGHASVELRWDAGISAATVRPDHNGVFEIDLAVPATLDVGEHTLSAVDAVATGGAVHGPGALASTTVVVVDAAASPRPGVERMSPGGSVTATPPVAAGSPQAGATAPTSAASGKATETPGSDGSQPSAGPSTPKPKPKPTATSQGPVHGALYVAPNGNDANPGTAGAPYRSVQKGLDSVRPGQTLYLRGGTYVENVQASPAGTSSARILVSAYPGERPVIKGLVSISDPRYVTFSGFNVTWNSGGYDEHMFKISGGSGWVLQNSEIWGARSFADLLIAGSPHGWAVRYNIIHDTYGGESNVNRSHNLYANTNLDATGGVIERNLIYNATHGTNVKLAGAGGSGGGAANVIVRYNTLYNATQPLLIGDGSHNITVTRNIIGKSAKDGVVRLFQLVGSGNTVKDNVLFGGRSACDDYESPVSCSSVMSANHFPLDPKFGSGLKPTDAVARNYGRFAP